MKFFNARTMFASALVAMLSVLDPMATRAAAQSIPISDQPLFSTTGVPPLMMMVMSRDEQLFNKAYPDYTDLDPDSHNGIDTTYNDGFDYSGYFDPKLCYAYASSQFSASAAATGTNLHQCSSAWSGNFLNWAAMSRVDLLRFVLYGGMRSTDGATTVLERAYIPNDLHAWAKVYRGSDVANYVPGATGPVTLCSASFTANGGGDPTMRVVNGDFPEWAATALSQCNWRDDVSGSGACVGGNSSSCDDAPKAAALGGGSNGDFTVRTQVCGSTNPATRESFCQKYTNSAGTVAYKPVGLLQNYGETGKLRFGLISGSYSAPRTGGVLRRNIGKFAGNSTTVACAPGDEVNLSNGQFCNQTAGSEGIINTMNRFKLTHWSGSVWDDCGTYGILNRDSSTHLNDPGASGSGSYNCSGWGNPLSEMYAEALRYISGEAKTSSFTVSGDLSGLPAPAWLDPYRSPATGGNPYCASCSILVLASGLNSFDGDEVPNVDTLGDTAANLSDKVGQNESITGTYSALVGRALDNLVTTTQPVQTATNTHVDLCTPKTVDKLSVVRGVCPDIPSMEGSYLLPGLAYKAWTTDLRPGLTDSHGNPKPTPTITRDTRNTVQTYAVALAENLPKFEIALGNNTVTLAPLCQANNSGSADGLGGTNDANWRSCFLGSVSIGSKTSTLNSRYVYGRPLAADGSAGSFSLVWEDSLWGNDHDNDVVSMLTYCIGTACTRSTGLPTTTQRKLCYYTATNYGGTETCPTALTGNQTVTVKSVRVPSGYTLTLYANTNQGGASASYTADTTSLNFNAKSYKVTGGTLPPGVASYTGYDICWRTTSTGNDQSPVCGTSGTPTVGANEVLIRIENMSAYAGNAMLTGYAVTGSNADGIKRLTLRPGSSDESILTHVLEPPANWYKPMVLKFSAGTSTAHQLENPLLYAAKYGGFTKLNTALNKRLPPQANEMPVPGLSADWSALDSSGNPTSTPTNYFLVRNPAKLKDQLQKVFDSVLSGVQDIGSVAASSGRFAYGLTKAYQASYDPSDWSGNLQISDLNADGSLGAQGPNASDNIPAAASRAIHVGVPQLPGTGYAAPMFASSNLSTPMVTALTTAAGFPTSPATTIDNLVAYLRGDSSLEQPAGPYRKRVSKLGDIVNSSPQVAYKTSLGYDQLTTLTGYDSYQAFVAAKTATTVFVGANDGMFHAFDGLTAVENFAYIPNAVISKLGTLSKPGYTHTFFVDGTPSIGDAYLSGWKTIVAASGGAGSRSVFAIDATNGAWGGLRFEFNDQTDADMGYFTGIPTPPTVTADSNWVTAFGNGYNGASNKAKLFVINLSDGSKVPVDDITNTANAAPNGLSTATIVDAQGTCPDGTNQCSDGFGDTIYAGDYLGNVWKFTLSGGRWVVSSQPLFQAKDNAGNVQPITSGMFAIRNPLGGVIVYFGTGKYLNTTDNDPSAQVQVNSLYAIWDDGSGTTVTRSQLQEQDITSYASSLWTITQNQFGYKTANYPQGKMGWFLDLTAPGTPDPLQGERILAAPVGSLDKLLVNAFRPTGEVCQPGGQNSFLELDALTGAAAFPGGNGGVGGAGTGSGGVDIPGNGPPLNSPNPVITIPPHTGIPAIPGCPAGNPNCVTNPPAWCTTGVAGYPNCPCANPAAPIGTPATDPACAPPTSCPIGAPGYPYCPNSEQCSLIANPGTAPPAEPFQCRASWRQLR